MVITNGYNLAGPNHRQNRRRERPGSRIRKGRKSHIQSSIQSDFQEGILDARDSDLSLPSDVSKPSPLLRQNFEQSWNRWKTRQAEEKAIAEMDRMQLEQEQIKLFGGDVNDDVSLCEPMLEVVYRLFGGIDYTDP
jgi:hypothetical protein